MSPRRSPAPFRRSCRFAVCGLTAALLVVPGIAHADTTPPSTDPLTGMTDQLSRTAQDVAKSVTDRTSPGAAGQVSDVVPGAGSATGSGTGSAAGADPGTGPGDGTGGAAAPSLDPAQLTALLGTLGVSPDCAPAIQDDLQLTLASIPATVQQVVTELGDNLGRLQADPAKGAALLQDALTQLTGGAAATAGAPTGVPLVDALQQLVADFVAVCLPQQGAATPPPPPPPAQAVRQDTPAPAPASTTTADAPVAYLGYAPTGAPDEPGSGAPLLAVGSALLVAGGAAATWMRARRAASSRS